jgi:hypothetical protein
LGYSSPVSCANTTPTWNYGGMIILKEAALRSRKEGLEELKYMQQKDVHNHSSNVGAYCYASMLASVCKIYGASQYYALLSKLLESLGRSPLEVIAS